MRRVCMAMAWCLALCLTLCLTAGMLFLPGTAAADTTIYDISPMDGATFSLGETVTASARPGGIYVYTYISGIQLDLPYRLYFRISRNGKTELFEYQKYTDPGTKLSVSFVPEETGTYLVEIQKVKPHRTDNPNAYEYVWLASEDEFQAEVSRKFYVRNQGDPVNPEDDPNVPYYTQRGTILAATWGARVNECAENLFDGNGQTKLCVIGSKAYMIWKAPAPIRVSAYVMMVGNDTSYYTGRNPKSWVLYGSKVQLSRFSTDWVKIDEVRNDTVLQPVDFQEFTFTPATTPAVYQYYRIEILDNGGDSCAQLSELYLKGTEPGDPTDLTEPVVVDNGEYRIDGDTATFLGAEDEDVTSFKIRDQITIVDADYEEHSIPVTAIATRAFYQNTGLKTVTVGKNVKRIGKNAFASCKKLATVKGGASVVTIGEAAFSGCKALKTFPAMGKLQTVGTKAFKDCVKLAKITLGAQVKSIGKKAFSGCKALKNITVKTEKLTEKNVGAGAFTGIYKKAVFHCPASMLEAYRKLFVKRGAPKTSIFK